MRSETEGALPNLTRPWADERGRGELLVLAQQRRSLPGVVRSVVERRELVSGASSLTTATTVERGGAVPLLQHASHSHVSERRAGAQARSMQLTDIPSHRTREHRQAAESAATTVVALPSPTAACARGDRARGGPA